jgi:hypothetical protein
MKNTSIMDKNVQNFENVILDNKNTIDIKYNVDKNIEASVRYQYLCESFNNKEVDSAIAELGITMLELYDIDNFNNLVEILNKSI